MTKIKHAERAHSKLGASSAERWINCPGSVKLSEQCPKPPDSEYAAEGTFAHELCEHVLKENISRDKLEKITHFKGKEIPKEMRDHVFIYVDHVRALRKEIGDGAEYLMEQKFHLKHIHPDLFGTSDFTIREEFGKLIVIDFKYGAGIAVDVEENEQLLYYALGASHGGIFSEVELHIVQPRADHSDGPIRIWKTDPARLMEFAKMLKAAAIATQEDDAPLNDGDHCRWCNAKAICPKLMEKAITTAQTDFKDPVLNLPRLEELTDEQIINVVNFQKQIENWFEAVKDFALLRMQNGEKIPGLKIVAKRAYRKWINEDEAQRDLYKEFGERIYEKKFLSASQAEKVLGKDAILGKCESLSSGVTIAPEGDRRKAITSAKDDFAGID